jgi:LacI family fructose operon transcriptional repressor
VSSIKDVAKAAGVSTATVSRVLSNTSYTSETVRTRVLDAVTRLDYRPNRVARSLRVQKSTILGLIVADIQNPFFTAVSRAVEDTAFENGLNMFLCNSDERIEKERMYIELMRDENVAGIILAPTHQDDETAHSILSHSIPTVVIDRGLKNADIDTVIIDNEDAAMKLTNHVLKTGKKRPLIFVGSSSSTGIYRHRGYTAALTEAGISVTDDMVHFVDAKEESGYKAMSQVMASSIKYDSVIATNGLLAAGIFRKLKESKVKIPDDISFACFDETLWTPIVEPAITVIRQPTYEIGQTAVELLLRKLNTDKTITARKIILNAELVIRASTVST